MPVYLVYEYQTSGHIVVGCYTDITLAINKYLEKQSERYIITEI